MTELHFVRAAVAASAVFLFSSFSSAGAPFIPTCGSGACSSGFDCISVMVSDCASAVPCGSGSSCPEAEPCPTRLEYGCTPARCSVSDIGIGYDAQCAPGMVCHTWTEACPVTDCACAADTPG